MTPRMEHIFVYNGMKQAWWNKYAHSTLGKRAFLVKSHILYALSNDTLVIDIRLQKLIIIININNYEKKGTCIFE